MPVTLVIRYGVFSDPSGGRCKRFATDSSVQPRSGRPKLMQSIKSFVRYSKRICRVNIYVEIVIGLRSDQRQFQVQDVLYSMQHFQKEREQGEVLA